MDNAIAIARETVETLTAPLQFTLNDGQPVVAKVDVPGAGRDKRTGTFVWHDVEIYDGRPNADRLDLDRYRLIRNRSVVSNWFDDDEVRRVGYPEPKHWSGRSPAVPRS